MAASICSASSLPPPWCAYCCISARDTTPLVMHSVSPPVGYPYTATCDVFEGAWFRSVSPRHKHARADSTRTTLLRSSGSSPNESASGAPAPWATSSGLGSQKDSSSTVSIARSQSLAVWRTVAAKRSGEPCLRTSTYVSLAITCAFVRMRLRGKRARAICHRCASGCHISRESIGCGRCSTGRLVGGSHRPLITRPEPVPSCCRRFCHGMAMDGAATTSSESEYEGTGQWER